ncbi:MAG: hypothetical protein ACHQY1_01155 [Myxococcota bacterium]
MKVLEIVLAVVFAALGVHSVVHWVRRPFASQDMTDQVLFALFVTARAGWWFAASGLFALYATMGEQGDVAVTVRRYDWYLVLLISLAALQFVSGFILGRRTSDGSSDG